MLVAGADLGRTTPVVISQIVSNFFVHAAREHHPVAALGRQPILASDPDFHVVRHHHPGWRVTVIIAAQRRAPHLLGRTLQFERNDDVFGAIDRDGVHHPNVLGQILDRPLRIEDAVMPAHLHGLDCALLAVSCLHGRLITLENRAAIGFVHGKHTHVGMTVAVTADGQPFPLFVERGFFFQQLYLACLILRGAMTPELRAIFGGCRGVGEHGVVQIVLVLHLDFPVGLEPVGEHAGAGIEFPVGRAVDHVIDVAFHRAEKLIEIGTIGAQTAKDETAIDRHARHLHQIELAAAQEFLGIALGVGRADMATVGVLDPAMVRAFETLGVAFVLGTNLRTAMRTAVEH